MKRFLKYPFLFSAVLLISACSVRKNNNENEKSTIYKQATIITGTASQPLKGYDMLVKNGRIEAIAPNIEKSGAEIVHLSGKTVIPALISAHVHVGNLQGNEAHGNHFTPENVLRQLKKYQEYGILWVQSMGTDQKSLFENGLYDSIKAGKKAGARLLSAGWGFGIEKGAPPFPDHHGGDNVFRPKTASEVAGNVQELRKYPIDLVKVWVDDFGKGLPKMKEAIYSEVIKHAHRNHLRVASHLYYLDDAHRLAQDGVQIFAHSVRDAEIDDALIREMKTKNISYIPTLTLDEYSYRYGVEKPDWLQTEFFKYSLEPGVYKMLSAPGYQQIFAKENPIDRNRSAFMMALKNAKKLLDAGVLVGMGTDSGAMPIRTQGFSEHRELQLLVKAGFTPMQALQAATLSNAKILKLDRDYGSLEKGKVADFVVLDADPVLDISNTQKIKAVYKAGEKVSAGIQ